MSIEDVVGVDLYERMRRALQATFPDTQTTITDAVVDAAFQVAKFDWNADALANVDIPKPVAAAVPAGTPFQYYMGFATHTRTWAPHSSFTGQLPLVRFRLPEHGTTATAPTISTPGGDLLPADHLNPSVDVLWSTYGSDPLLTFGRPARVDMITPPRINGARFAAISLYLCYANESDPGPSFYILEAGLATGQPRIPFLGRTMDATILQQAQYKPTTFSQPWHFYRGTLTMSDSDPGEPNTLLVEVFEQQPPVDQYLEVRVQYRKRSQPDVTYPFFLTVAAGARVQAIADALGVQSGLDPVWFLRLLDDVALKSLFTVPPEGS